MCSAYPAISWQSPPKLYPNSFLYRMLLTEILTHFHVPLHRLTPTSPGSITKGSVELVRLDLHPVVCDPLVPPSESQCHLPSPTVPHSSHRIPSLSPSSSQPFGSISSSSTFFPTDDFFTTPTPPRASSSSPPSSFGFDGPSFLDLPPFSSALALALALHLISSCSSPWL